MVIGSKPTCPSSAASPWSTSDRQARHDDRAAKHCGARRDAERGGLFAALFSSDKVAPVDAPKSGLPTGAVVLLIGGGVLVVTGVVLDIVAVTQRPPGDACKVAPSGSKLCLDADRGAVSTSNTLATVGDITWITGAVAVTTGIVLAATRKRPETASKPEAIVTPVVTPGFGGVAVRTTAAPGHVIVGLGVRAGDFTKVAVKRGAGGHSVIFALTQKPAPPPTTTTQTVTPTTTTPTFTQTTTQTQRRRRRRRRRTARPPAAAAAPAAAAQDDDADLHRQLEARSPRPSWTWPQRHVLYQVQCPKRDVLRRLKGTGSKVPAHGLLPLGHHVSPGPVTNV